MRNVPWISGGLVALLIAVALAVPLLGLPSPVTIDVAGRFAGPGPAHLLGQDEYGRDVLSRLLWGARVSLFVAITAAALACVVGTAMGILGGYLGSVAEFLTLRLSDVLLCFPPLLLALLVVTLFGPGAATLIPILAIVYAPSFARVAYAGVLSARSHDYVEAMRALGAGKGRIMLRTILPNVAGPILVQFSLTVAASIVLESGLSFLGLGVVPPQPSWGLMIGAARATMGQAPQLLLWPCAALTLTILLINALCDGLRDMVDPQPAARPRRGVLSTVAAALTPQRPAVLSVDRLTIDISPVPGKLPTVRDVSFDIAAGETVALVGESGSGKSLASLALLGLLPTAAEVKSGAAWLEGVPLLGAPDEEVRRMRGDKIAMIFQDPMSSLNPVFRVGDQIAEAILVHRDVGRAEAGRRAVALLRKVGVPDPERRARAFPHELSGGMRQRVMIAMAVANEPRVLIADEPTTALDVTVQAQVLDVLADLKREQGIALLFITHSLPLVAEMADRVIVLYAGEIVETGRVAEVFGRPRHPYTRALLDSAPHEDGPPPEGIPGSVPHAFALPAGCRFAPRCAMREPACEAHPELEAVDEASATRCRRWRDMR